MNTLLGFAPFVVFAVIDRLLGSTLGLAAGAATSAIVIAWDVLLRHRSAKILEIGTLLLFGGLAIYAIVARPSWSIIGVRLWVDAGLLVIVLLSIVLRRPFTLQYATERSDVKTEMSPAFVRANYVISWVWAAAFAVLVAADLLMLTQPDVPLRVGIVTTIAALYAAIKFTSWYPDHLAKTVRV